jgi:hypothetical protein
MILSYQMRTFFEMDNQDLLVETKSIGDFGLKTRIRITHKPTGLSVEGQCKYNDSTYDLFDLLVKQLKKKIINYVELKRQSVLFCPGCEFINEQDVVTCKRCGDYVLNRI